ncbi:hypothetical protein AAZX31_18G212300 [Glycine max]
MQYYHQSCRGGCFDTTASLCVIILRCCCRISLVELEILLTFEYLLLMNLCNGDNSTYHMCILNGRIFS